MWVWVWVWVSPTPANVRRRTCIAMPVCVSGVCVRVFDVPLPPGDVRRRPCIGAVRHIGSRRAVGKRAPPSESGWGPEQAVGVRVHGRFLMRPRGSLSEGVGVASGLWENGFVLAFLLTISPHHRFAAQVCEKIVAAYERRYPPNHPMIGMRGARRLGPELTALGQLLTFLRALWPLCLLHFL